MEVATALRAGGKIHGEGNKSIDANGAHFKRVSDASGAFIATSRDLSTFHSLWKFYHRESIRLIRKRSPKKENSPIICLKSMLISANANVPQKPSSSETFFVAHIFHRLQKFYVAIDNPQFGDAQRIAYENRGVGENENKHDRASDGVMRCSTYNSAPFMPRKLLA